MTKRIITKPYTIVNTPATKRSRQLAARKGAWTRHIRGHDKHTESTKEKLRIASAEQIANSPERCVSKLEDVVATEFRRRHIRFRRQVHIRNPVTGRFIAVVDFLLKKRTVIEVNGTFWHSDPRSYPDGPIHPAQHRTAERYTRKCHYLKQNGYSIIELWEADIRKNLSAAISSLISEL